ncbi:MAG: phosphoenolpyruvate carboxylase [Actinomycetota bacterium]|nr:phosphoenolpyruvate carboxylase [Actinomycetota bacterium]
MDVAAALAARSFATDRALLLDAFQEVVRRSEGEGVLDVPERAVGLARRARAGDEAAADDLETLVAGLGPHDAELFVRTLTRWFQLVNLAEDNERIRRLRAREAREAPAARRGSLLEAVRRLADAGLGADEAGALLAGAEVRLVLTAHPTEARRRTTLEKLARVFGVLRDLDERPGMAEAEARRRLLPTIQELWGSDELRAVSPTVLDEVRTSLVWFVTTLVHVVPAVYRDLEEALEATYPGEFVAVPPLLSFGSWIGGDRDGNPHVTPEVTEESLDLMREQCLRLLEARVGMLAGRLSLSERVVGGAPTLGRILATGEQHFPALAEQLAALNAVEPYRRALTFMRERLRATRRREDGAYAAPHELIADLRTVEGALVDGGGGLTAAGDLHDVLRQVEVFGFHFARLDIREHAGRHRDALHEVFAALGVLDGYAQLGPEARLDALCAAIADRRPLIPGDLSSFSEATRDVIRAFRVVARLRRAGHAGALQAYVISGTEGPADLLEVLLLCKEAGLARAGGEGQALRIVPLFEAGATLESAPATMDSALARPEYRAALRAVGDEQEVMIGYSDSNKDSGYVASGWATYRAQVRVSEVLREHGATWCFFHGRGGALGRGGGPTNTAILALPRGTVGARLKMTEQGEVLAAKYAVAAVAHRELELTTSAALLSALPRTGADRRARPGEHERVVQEMARRSEDAYRALVQGDPDFARFFAAATPVEEISRLRIGSRPAKRRADGGIESLRAIPWVFSWTQARIVLPAWYGLGTALSQAREEHGLDLLREMQRTWPFFSTLLANAEMACAKADLHIARRYVALWDEDEPRERIWAALREEYERTTAELLLVGDERRLLDRAPVLQESIDRRNPYVDPLSFLQVELLRRVRRSDATGAEETLQRLSLLCVNGIAGGLRNTG